MPGRNSAAESRDSASPGSPVRRPGLSKSSWSLCTDASQSIKWILPSAADGAARARMIPWLLRQKGDVRGPTIPPKEEERRHDRGERDDRRDEEELAVYGVEREVGRLRICLCQRLV